MEDELLGFVQTTFKTMWSLELAVFLMNHPEQAWTADALVRELRGSHPVVLQSLASLEAAGLVAAEADGSVRFAPASAELDRLARAVAEAYRERPMTVRRVILTAPNEKLHTLADAFRLKRD